jgi:hypothetical protein
MRGLYHLQRRNHAVPRLARRSRASDAQREKLTGRLGELEAAERVLARYSKGRQAKKAVSARTATTATKAAAPARQRGRTTPAKPAGGMRASPTLGEQVLALADGKTQQEITAASRGAPEPSRRRHCRHKRAGRIELPDGSSTPRSRRRREQRAAVSHPSRGIDQEARRHAERPQVMLKLAILDVPDFYSALTNHTATITSPSTPRTPSGLSRRTKLRSTPSSRPHATGRFRPDASLPTVSGGDRNFRTNSARDGGESTGWGSAIMAEPTMRGRRSTGSMASRR